MKRTIPLTLRALVLYGLVGCCTLSLVLGALRSAGQAVGILPTSTPRPPTATPGPTNTPEPTRTPAPSRTPEPTRTAAPSRTPEPTRTPRPTADPAIQQTAQAGRQAAIATGVAVGALPCRTGQYKANINSGIFHAPGQRDYEKTQDNVRCFDTADEARAAGFRQAER